MRVIAHVSDLHFGRVDPATPLALRRAILAAKPDVIVVSGDLTQRARRREFEAARHFLDELPFPRVVVPGNHDVPLYDLITRAVAPFRAYRQHFATDLEPFFIDPEIAIQGVNTARVLTIKNGRINPAQVERSRARLERCGPAVTRVIVTHHPFDGPVGGDDRGLIGRAEMAMAAFARCRVDLILSGHLHVGHSAPSTVRYGGSGWASLLVQAGTATSTRRRDEPNAFNLIRVNRPRMVIETLSLTGGAFTMIATAGFHGGPDGWTSEGPDIGFTPEDEAGSC